MKNGAVIFARKCSCGATYWQVGPVLAMCPWKRRHAGDPVLNARNP